MRNIKFRCWDKTDKIMWLPLHLDEIIKGGWELTSEDNEHSLPHGDYNAFLNPTEVVWMQFAGLLDKNKKEIYEGDVLKRVGWIDIFQGSADDVFGADPLKITYEAVELKVCSNDFRSSSFGYSLNTQRTYTERTRPATYEIVGNIYENPELLQPK